MLSHDPSLHTLARLCVFVQVCVLESRFLQMTEASDPQVLDLQAVLSPTPSSHVCWELNPGSVQGHVLLTAELSSQPHMSLFSGLGRRLFCGQYFSVYTIFILSEQTARLCRCSK